MPKIFEYLGLVIFFYSNEHEPVHVHAAFSEYESKGVFLIENGEIVEIRIENVKGRKPLPTQKRKDFKDFLKRYGTEIVKKWVEYFVYKKEVRCEIITSKIK